MEENSLKADSLKADSLKAAFIIEKSKLSNFVEVQVVKNAIGTTTYLDYVYGEDKQSIKSIGLQQFSKSYQLETFQTSASVTREQISDLKGTFGIDVVAMVESVLVNETAIAMFKRFKTELDRLATVTYLNSYTKWDKFKAWLLKIFKKEYFKVSKVKTPTELLHLIVMEANRLNSLSRRGHVDYIIVNSQTGALLMDLPSYTMAPLNPIGRHNGTVYEAGHVAGLRVFVDPYMEWKNSTIYMGRKLKPDEPGIQFFYKEEADSIADIAEATMAPRIILKTRSALVTTGWYPQNQYTKIVYKYKGK